MDIFDNVRQEVIKYLNALITDNVLPKDCKFDHLTAEPPKDVSHGDVATNAAMVIAKNAGMKPRDLAEKLVEKLASSNLVEKIEIAGPGFINMHFKKDVLINLLMVILEQGKGFGNLDIGNNQKINIEYVSANPTGPMHIGHARGAVYGDALALLLLKAGYDVTKEFYVNDAGSQIETLAKSAFLRYEEALGKEIGEIPEGLYPGEYLKVVGESLKNEYGKDLLVMDKYERIDLIKKFAVETMLTLIKKDLADLGIYHDVFTSELDIQKRNLVDEALDILDSRGLIYKGVLEPPKGKKTDDWEERTQTLFKSTEFGDDIDRPIRKSDSSWTYFAADCAYHLDKIQRGYNNMVVVLGADHGGYVKRIKAAASALSDRKASLDIKISQLVNFLENGQPIKMSKRAGTFTTVSDVVKEVGKDVIRFIMLTRKNDAVLDFDLDVVKQQSKDNPVFYVQYAHARAKSVLRLARSEFAEAYKLSKEIDVNILKNLDSSDEMILIKNMASWPRVVKSAALSYEPHRIAFYLQDLAASFHALWNKGKNDEILRFIVKDNINITAARLAMIRSLTNVIASGLFIFNIVPIEEMR